MSAYVDSYYAQTASGDGEYPPLGETVTADVCIVGGGLAGLACALGLTERGKTVALLEGRRIGWGASGRNGGFCLAGYAASPSSIAKKIGMDNARTLYALTKDAQKLIRKRIDDFKIPAHPVDGHLKCSWFDAPDEMRKSVDYMAENFGENVEFWDREKVREVCKTEEYYDAIFFPDYFHMHPLNYALGLAKAIGDKGGRIFEDTMATNVEQAADGFAVHAESGKVECAEVVYCGSAYFNALVKKLSRACLPVSTYVMVTEPVDPDRLAEAITEPYAIRDTRWADDYYRVLPDNRILWGGRCGLGRSVPDDLPEEMLKDLLKIYPQLEGAVKPESSWAGIMGYTVHRMPHIGKLAPGQWACTNFGGNGVGPTTAGGEVIARAIAEDDMTYKLFEPFGYMYTGSALGPLVAQAVYHGWELRDAIQTLKYRRAS